MTADPTDPTELGRYVVTRPWWRWMPGMLVRNSVDTGTVTGCWHVDYGNDGRSTGPPAAVFVQFDEECPAVDILAPGGGAWLPGLTDPATRGCLLALAEELAGGPVSLQFRVGAVGSLPPWQAVAHTVKDGAYPLTEAAPTRALALVRLCDALVDGGGG